MSIGIHPGAHPLLWLSSVVSAGLSLFIIWDVHVPGDAGNDYERPGRFLGRMGDATSGLFSQNRNFARSVEWARRRAAWIDGAVSTTVFISAWWSASSMEVGVGEISSTWLMALPALCEFTFAENAWMVLQPFLYSKLTWALQ